VRLAIASWASVAHFAPSPQHDMNRLFASPCRLSLSRLAVFGSRGSGEEKRALVGKAFPTASRLARHSEFPSP
jgi:hypothetical protein